MAIMLSRKNFWLSVVLAAILILTTSAKKPLHTRLTGFASRSPNKSIFQKEVLPPLNSTTTDSSSTLWVHYTEGKLWFQSRNATTNTTLCISGEDVKQCNQDEESQEWIPIQGIYGMFPVPSGSIWVLVTRGDDVYQNKHLHVCRVHSLELVHVKNSNKQLSQRQIKEEARQVRLLRQALRHHVFYYIATASSSILPDMTKSLQKSFLQDESSPDSRFYWNEPSVQPLLQDDEYFALMPHVIPLTSAFCGVQQNVSLTSTLRYDELLISRRSRFRAGTRFTKRGADATGAVANYAETEQLCWLYNNTTLQQVSSHVQTRGSIPLRWSSPADVKTYRPRVYIGTDPLAQARAVRSHVKREFATYALPRQHGKYPQLVFVNLIDKQQDQGRLGRAFDAVLQAVLDVYNGTTAPDHLPPNSVKHLWFDFHHEVKHGKWERLNSLLKDMVPTLEEQGYFCAVPPNKNNTTEWKILRTQTGIVRTNCMDCLDRTNVVQSIFARYMLYKQLEAVNRKRVLPLEYAVAFRRNDMALPWASGEVSHRMLWADNADAISKLYAGTAALKGDFTRTGKRTKRGALDDGMNSLQRYYLNNFMDADRQEGVDLLVGHADFSTEDSFDPVSLQRAARSLLLSSSASEESKHVLIKQSKRRPTSPPGGLDLRWLPGDLQSHLKSHASGVTKETKEALESMDHRSASGQPWWVTTEDSSSNEDDSDDEGMAPSSINTGHVIGALVAAIQAPATTAAAIVCMLGLANAGILVPKEATRSS